MNIQEALKETGMAVRGTTEEANWYVKVCSSQSVLHWHNDGSRQSAVALDTLLNNNWLPYHPKEKIYRESVNEMRCHNWHGCDQVGLLLKDCGEISDTEAWAVYECPKCGTKYTVTPKEKRECTCDKILHPVPCPIHRFDIPVTPPEDFPLSEIGVGDEIIETDTGDKGIVTRIECSSKIWCLFECREYEMFIRLAALEITKKAPKAEEFGFCMDNHLLLPKEPVEECESCKKVRYYNELSGEIRSTMVTRALSKYEEDVVHLLKQDCIKNGCGRRGEK